MTAVDRVQVLLEHGIVVGALRGSGREPVPAVFIVVLLAFPYKERDNPKQNDNNRHNNENNDRARARVCAI